jgi:hypothetical protein
MGSEQISRVMDKAQRADRLALFAGLQAAVVALVDAKHGAMVGDPFVQIERALDAGHPYGFDLTRRPG